MIEDIPLNILPCEALLLGLCVGEYGAVDAQMRDDRMPQFVNNLRYRFIPLHLGPHVRANDQEVSELDAPADVLWMQHKHTGLRIGWSRSDPWGKLI